MQFSEITPNDIPELFRIRTGVRENLLTMEDLTAAGITAESVTAMLGATHKGWLCRVADDTTADTTADAAHGNCTDGNTASCRGTAAGFVMADGATGELWVLAVLPQFEGRGIGSELLQRAEQWLFAQGHQELWLWTDTDTSLRAYKLYKRHGWQDAEVKDGDLYLRKHVQ